MKSELEINNHNKIEHLKMIQNVINRMGWNSFYIKGIVATLTLPFLYLTIDKGYLSWWVFLTFGILIFLFILFMWRLDAFFLFQERLYRKFYDEVRNKKGKIDFSMDASKFASKNGIFYVMLSKTLRWFYGFFLFSSITLTILMNVI